MHTMGLGLFRKYQPGSKDAPLPPVRHTPELDAFRENNLAQIGTMAMYEAMAAPDFSQQTGTLALLEALESSRASVPHPRPVVAVEVLHQQAS
jgi:hypothetical protein